MDIPLLHKPKPNNTFIDYENTCTKYDANTIYNYATQLAYYFKHTLKIKERSSVVLIFESGITNLITFIACIMANLIPVVLCPNNILKIKAIIKECSPQYAFISSKINDLLSNKIENLFTLSNLDERFNTCINLINDYKGIIKIDMNNTLKLYSYYKQAIEGDNNMPKPGIFNPKQKMKWDAWNKLQDTSTQEAKTQYCAMAQKLLNKHALLQNILAIPQQVIDTVNLNPNESYFIKHDYPVKNMNEICFFQYSSGSTSNPKGVKITHANIQHNLNELVKITKNKKYLDNPTSISWLPHYHDMGLIGGYLSKYYISLLMSGQSIYCMSPHYFLQNVQDIYTNLFTQVCSVEMPNFAMNYLHDNIQLDDSLDLSNINLVWCGSEKINRQVQEKFVEKFQKNKFNPGAIINCYGLAENTLIVSHGSYMDKIVNDTISVGKTIDGTDYVIINEETNEYCQENTTGMVYLTGPSCTHGYLNQSLNQQSFVNINNVIYYRTGDLGFMSEGLLYIQGRDCEKIIINGKNMYPEDIEQSLLSLRNILLQNVVTFGINNGITEKVVIVIEGSPNMKPDFNIIKINLLRTFGFNVYNIVFVPLGTIPKTSSSKKMRTKIKQMYLDKQLTILDQYRNLSDDIDNTHLYQEIIEDFNIFSEVDYEISKNSTLIELGMDSMTYSMYAQKIEARNKKDVYFDMAVCNDVTLEQFYELLLFVYDKTDKVDPIFLKEKGVYLSDELKKTLIKDSQITEDELPKYTTIGKKMAHNPDTILLTGATGYLGIYMLYEFLSRTNSIIVCLIRATDNNHAFQRIKNKLKEQNLSIPDNILSQRCRFLKGDVGKPLLGFEEEEYNYLASNIDVVFHSAAEINYVASYNSLKNSNVDGTKNIIKFCFQSQKKELHFIGSTLIFGWTHIKNLLETHCNQDCVDIALGYGQCKWVGEQLIYNARKYGLVSKCYRSTFVTASKMTKEYTSSDIVSILFEYSIKKKISIKEDLLFDAVSVDCSSKNIISLAKIDDYYDKTFHLTQSEGQPITDFYKLIKIRLGIEMKEMNFMDFVEYVTKNATPNDAIYPLIPFINENKEGIMRMESKIYNNDWTKSCFKKHNLPYYSYTIRENINAVVDFLINKHLI